MATAPDAQINHADAIAYWESIGADVNGMLGGFPHISRVDLQGSKNFMGKLGIKGKTLERVVDCGAGIGRITNGLLVHLAETVDIVEPITKFTSVLRDQPGIGTIYSVGLEAWSPPPEVRYDLIWNQWCLGHLTDAQLVEYLVKCGNVLKEGGYVIVKENMSTHLEGKDEFDQVDNSVTRADQSFRKIFEKAGLIIKKTELAKGFPAGLCPVRIYALQPK
ncbi:putative methyltransferase protein [Rutstroemia sp. NJR-2017a WRK4]|nr:putative methyltransferase protein [Rutstroemia sp. NJR-2017a WRK4]